MSMPILSLPSPGNPNPQDGHVPATFVVQNMPSQKVKQKGIIVPVQYIVPRHASVVPKGGATELSRILPSTPIVTTVQACAVHQVGVSSASSFAPHFTSMQPMCSQIPIVHPTVDNFGLRITSVVGSYNEQSEDTSGKGSTAGSEDRYGTETGSITVGGTDHCYFKDVAMEVDHGDVAMEVEHGDSSDATSEDTAAAETTLLAASCRAIEKDHNYKKNLQMTETEWQSSCNSCYLLQAGSVDFDDTVDDTVQGTGNEGGAPERVSSHAQCQKKVLEIPVDTEEDQENLRREIRIHKGSLHNAVRRCRRSKSTLRTQKRRLKQLQSLLFSEKVVQRDGRDVVEVTLSRYVLELFADSGFPTKDGEVWGDKQGAEDAADDGSHTHVEKLEVTEVPVDS